MLDLNLLCSQLDLDPLAQGLQVIDAQDLARDYFPRLDGDRPVLVANLASRELALAVRRTLLVIYPAAHQVKLLNGNKAVSRTLGAFSRGSKYSKSTVLYLPPMPKPGSPQTVAAIIARLRAPGGCPWDRKQTHASLRRALIEETYEVIEAIDEGDPAKLREELGDLLLHVLFQTQIARDQDEFTLAEVGAELAAKLIRRHPHVFGEVEVAGADEVVANWERIKQAEKRAAGAHPAPASLDANIPREMPALARAQKICERARRAGMALSADHLPDGLVGRMGRGKKREQELGELLFALAAWADENGLDATSALRGATARFVEKTAGAKAI
jgi:tetrapyrrole methylase family protein/MazG family protein